MAQPISTLPATPSPLASASGTERALVALGLDPRARPGETARARDDRLDTELMALFRDSGRSDVFEALHRHARGRLLQWIRWLIQQRRARLDPGDLLQDTFVNVYRYAAGFRDEHRGSFRSWVRTIAANLLRRAVSIAPRFSVQALPEGLQEPPDPARGPALRLAESEESELLGRAWSIFLQHYARAYEKLSPRDREALRCVELEGLSYADTGALLGVGPSNMKMIMLRSRRRLLAHMRSAMMLAQAQQARLSA